MKKVLSIMLVIAMAATLFAGCGETTPTPSTSNNPSASASAAPTSNEPTKDPKTSWKSIWKKGDALVAVSVYDTDNYLSDWGIGSKVLMAEYGLKLGTVIAPVLADQIEINDYSLLKTSSGRSTYTAAISNLFLSADTTPDIMPALYATNTGTGAIFKGTIGKKYLVDLAPFLEEGGALDNYVSYVWGDNYGDASYWDTIKEALMTEDGALYAIPRLEYTPVKRLTFFNTDALEALNMEQPTTLAELETALAAWVAEDHTGFTFNPSYLTIESIITPIANMYGIDFDSSFDWKEMNGEPMFSYYYPEYLEVLKTVNKWASNGWITTSKDYAGRIAMCGDLSSDDNAKKDDIKSQAKHALAMYGEANHGSKLKDERLWQSSTISAAGYTAAVSSESAVDYNYFAITNRSVTADTEEGYATVLRIMDYVNYTFSHEAYIKATFGREGINFADSWEESGNFVWVEKDGKMYIRDIGGSDRYRMQLDDDPDTPAYASKKPWYRTLHPLYTWVLDVCNGFKSGDDVWREEWGFDKLKMKYVEGLEQAEDGSFNFNEVCDRTWDAWITPSDKYDGKSEWQYYADLASAPIEEGGYGITEFKYGTYTEGVTKLWTRDGYSGGITWFADVTAFPMQYTIYGDSESQATMYPIRDLVVAEVSYEGTNTLIYPGFFPDAKEVLSGSEAEEVELKIESVKQLAKNFTIDYLCGTKGDSDWVNYLKSLKDAGIEEVYEFYAHNAYAFTTKHKDGTRSMSDVIAENSKK